MREGTDETARVLREARDLISDRENWLPLGGWFQGESKCCAGGAILKVIKGADSGDLYDTEAASLLGVAMGASSGDKAEQIIQIPRFNDTHSHKQVLAAFDKAIELAEAKS